MEQEEQAPAVGVLKNENVRARGQRRKQKDPFKYLNRAILIFFFMCTVSCLFEEAPKSKHSKDKSFVHKSSISDRAYENYPRINVQNIRTFCSKVSYLSSMMYMCTLKGMYSAMISMSATAILVNSRLMGLARMSCTQTDVNTKFRNNI